MPNISLIPFLFAAQIAFLIAVSRRASRGTSPILIPIALLTFWAAASSYLAISGVYNSDWFIALWPGLWLPLVPGVLIGLSFILSPVRILLQKGIRSTPATWFVAIQALRVMAIGTLIKTLQGEFPLQVELAIGLTDLAFGISAIPMLLLLRRNLISSSALIVWHVVGVMIIILPGGLAIQSSLPGWLSEASGMPASDSILSFPMALAPSLVVPIFLIFSAFAVFREVEDHTARGQ